MIEEAIQENTAALLDLAASNRELAQAMRRRGPEGVVLTSEEINEGEPSKSPKTQKSPEKNSEGKTETAAQKKKRIAKEKREAKAMEEAAKKAEGEGDSDKEEPGAATEEDCRALATYIIKEKKDKAALAGVLKANNISMISEFGEKGEWSELLEQLEEAAGKTLAEVS